MYYDSEIFVRNLNSEQEDFKLDHVTAVTRGCNGKYRPAEVSLVWYALFWGENVQICSPAVR